MPGQVTWTLQDFSQENSRVTLDVTTPVNGTAYDALLAQLTPAFNVILPLTLGALVRRSISTQVLTYNNGAPGSPNAQRELKWYIPLRATAGGRGAGFTIPIAKLTGISGDPL